MAALSELILYLAKGCSLKNDVGERFTPDKSGDILYQKQETRSRMFAPEYYRLTEVKNIQSIWEWGVVFLDKNQKEYILADLAAIDEAIKQNKPRYVFGETTR